MKKRILAMILVVVLVFSLAATSLAASFTDVDKDYWAADAIERWADAGVLSGVGNDKYNPEGLVTRGQAAVIFANLLKLEESADLSKFYDMDHWSAPFVAKVYAAGIMNGLTNYLMGPEEHMSREQFFTMFAVAMGIEGQQFCMKSFTDYNEASAYALPYINALINLGYLSGRTATTLAPKMTMKRAEIASLLDRVITAYVTKDNETVTVEGNGIVLVVANNVTVVGDNFTGTAVATGDADKVTVTGSFNGSINVSNAGASVSLSGLTGQVNVNANASGVQVNNAPNGTTVTAKDDVTNVTVNGGAVQEDSSVTVGGTPSTPPVVVPPTCGHGAYKYVADLPTAGHSIYCAYCGVRVGTESCYPYIVVTKDPTCTEYGVGTCSRCGVDYIKWVNPTGEHNYTYTNNEDGTHTKTCSVGNESATESHNYVDGECVCGAVEPVEPPVVEKGIKFQLSVSSEYAEGKVTEVKGTVYDDYSAELVFPGTPVSASNVTLYAMMQNVASLGVGSKREHSITVNTGMSGVYDLEVYLKNAVEFKSGTVNVSIQGAAPFTYTLTGAPVAGTDETYGFNTITATPSSTAAARAAWQALTSHVETKDAPDSSITVANGSYMIIGSEKLCFETDDDLVLDNFNNIDELKQNIKDNVKVEPVTKSDDVVIYLAAETELAVGSSAAYLKDNATITISGATVTDGILSDIRTAASGDTKVLVKKLIDLVNQLVGAVDGETVNVAITFAPVVEEPVLPPVEEEVYEKFQLRVSSNYSITDNSGTTNGTTTVSATVYSDYSIKIDLPGTHVNSDDVTIYAMMNKVSGLNVSGKREHSLHVDTGLNKTVALADWMPLVLDFASATVNVDVEGNKFTYEFVGTPFNAPDTSAEYDSNAIVATTDKAAASAAWQVLTDDEVIESATGANNSSITIANGSYLIVDTEKLEFQTANNLVLDNINDLEALEKAIRDNVKLTSGLTDENKVVAVLKAGTELHVGSSYAKLLKDITITIEGMDVSATSLASKAHTATPLAAIRDAADTTTMVKNLVHLFDAIVGGMNGKTVNVTVDIAD